MIDLETRLRRAARLLDEASASGRSDVVIALDDDSSDNLDEFHSPGSPARRRWLTIAGVAAAAAAVVGLVVVTGSGDEAAAPGTEPASSGTEAPPGSSSSSTGDTATPGTRLSPDVPPTMEQLRGHRWVAVEVGGEPWPLASLPYVEFGTQDTESFITGNDGCNSFGGIGDLDDDRLVISEVVSEQMACLPERPIVVPEDGDRLMLSGNGTRLELRATGGDSARLVYRRLDPLPTGDTLTGGWYLDRDDSARVSFGDDGEMVLGGCKGLRFDLESSRLRLVDVPADPYSSCLDGAQDQALSALVEMLADGPALVSGDVYRTIYVAGDRSVLRLRRLPETTPAGAVSPRRRRPTSPHRRSTQAR